MFNTVFVYWTAEKYIYHSGTILLLVTIQMNNKRNIILSMPGIMMVQRKIQTVEEKHETWHTNVILKKSGTYGFQKEDDCGLITYREQMRQDWDNRPVTKSWMPKEKMLW